MLMQRVLLVRHGARADFGRDGFSKAPDKNRDVPLSDVGLAQARELARALASTGIDHIFASPYRRTLQTAHPIAALLGRDIKVEDGLGECLWDFPSPPEQLLSGDARLREFPRVDATYGAMMPTIVGPEPESVAKTRAGAVVSRIASAYDGTILIVGHGVTVLGAARALLGGTSPVQASFCSITRLDRLGTTWMLRRNGDVSHLGEATGAVQHTVVDGGP